MGWAAFLAFWCGQLQAAPEKPPHPIPPPKTYAILCGSVATGIRGDLSVADVAAKLTWAETMTHVYSYASTSCMVEDVQQDLDNLSLAPSDTVLFYYMGHGENVIPDFPEKPNPRAGGRMESLHPTQKDYLYDQDLTDLFNDDVLEEVRKVVILDSCHSGGFWNNDEWDLFSLPNVALLAAATPAGITTTDTRSGATPGTGHFTNDILPYLTRDATFAELAQHATYPGSNSVTGFFLDEGYGTVPYESAVSFSSDFDREAHLDGSPVPEPSPSVLLGVVGAILLLRAIGGKLATAALQRV